MNQEQINSILRSLLKIIGSALAAHGLTGAANIVNGQDCIGVVLAVAGLVWSHYSHTAPPAQPNKPTIKLGGLMVMGGLALGLSMAACNTTQQTTAYNTIASVDTAAKAAVDGYYTAAVKGLATTNNIPAIAKAYSEVEAGCVLAATTAQAGTNAVAPAELTQELQALLTLTSTVIINNK